MKKVIVLISVILTLMIGFLKMGSSNVYAVVDYNYYPNGIRFPIAPTWTFMGHKFRLATNFIVDLDPAVSLMKNLCDVDVFIPTKTTAERQSFAANRPSCITIGASYVTSYFDRDDPDGNGDYETSIITRPVNKVPPISCDQAGYTPVDVYNLRNFNYNNGQYLLFSKAKGYCGINNPALEAICGAQCTNGNGVSCADISVQFTCLEGTGASDYSQFIPLYGCMTPRGTTVANTRSVTAYSTPTVACGSSCSDVDEKRFCTNGVLGGSYQYGSCTVGACASCTTPWGTTLSHGQSVTAYASSSVACGVSCAAETRTCNNGVLGGSYTNQGCNKEACASCTTPWGETVSDGTSVTAYITDFAACGSLCRQQTKICSNGTLGFTSRYTYQTCEEESPCDTCFKPGTKIILQDESIKQIEDIKVGDVVIGSDNSENTVVKTFKLWNKGKLYAINGSDYFVTETHPFMTTEGWKSFNPKGSARENPKLIVTQLEVGDILITKTGIEKIYTVGYKIKPGYVYNFKLDKNHTYYADGYLVHNPDLKPIQYQ